MNKVQSTEVAADGNDPILTDESHPASHLNTVFAHKHVLSVPLMHKAGPRQVDSNVTVGVAATVQEEFTVTVRM